MEIFNSRDIELDIAFQMIKNCLTGFVAMQDFILKTLEKFSAVFPEVTLQS